MLRRANIRAVTLLLATGSALLMPQLGWASSGGASPATSGGGSASSSSRSGATAVTGVVAPGDATVSASGNGIAVASRASVLLSNQLRFTGSVSPSNAGHVVEIERLGHQTGWKWTPTAHGIASPSGSFTAVWPTNHIGQFSIRAVVEGRQGTISRAAAASPTFTIIVYRPAIATWYGTGFWGSQTACGVTLQPNTLGVANRTLKCGTRVAIYFNGRTITVPVIDRGPYANHADWDLTEATARAIGMDGTATIGAVSLPSR